MKLSALHHIAIIASDYPRSLRFYQALGFELTEERIRPHDILAMLHCGGMTIELFGKPDAPARVTNPEALGLRHLAFQVPDTEAAAAELSAIGIEVEPIRTDLDGAHFTFFKDPDGLPIEIRDR